ncbi:hypothetical protein GN956_G16435 [Arapaima gigas]
MFYCGVKCCSKAVYRGVALSWCVLYCVLVQRTSGWTRRLRVQGSPHVHSVITLTDTAAGSSLVKVLSWFAEPGSLS